MKIQPPSADLLIELAIGAAVLGGLAYLVWKVKDAAGTALSDAADVALHTGQQAVQAVNPANPENAFNRAATAGVAAVTGTVNDGTWSIGTKIYDFVHPDPSPVTTWDQGSAM